VCWLASNAVDRGFEPPVGSNHRLSKFLIAASLSTQYCIMSKGKDWLARNQDNVPKWSDMSTRGLLFR
jgi:hypothetical protein